MFIFPKTGLFIANLGWHGCQRLHMSRGVAGDRFFPARAAVLLAAARDPLQQLWRRLAIRAVNGKVSLNHVNY